ncbi:uncharacterized [Tachysurus ichikawai]
MGVGMVDGAGEGRGQRVSLAGLVWVDGSREINQSRLQSRFYPLLCLGVMKQLDGVTESIKTPVFTIQDNTAR